LSDAWTNLETALRNLGGLKQADIQGTGLEARSLQTLLSDGDLAPEEMAEELADTLNEIAEAKKQKK